MSLFAEKTPALISVLQAASRDRTDLSLRSFDENQVRWAIATGLGPLLFRTVQHDPEAAKSPLWPLLQGANCTARMIMDEQLDAMCEIIDACQGAAPTLTLLKGISICDQHYPEPHLRLMRDLDFLVEADAVTMVESILVALGYRQQPKGSLEAYKKHHHSAPFYNQRRGVWVEVHRRLFPLAGPLGAEEAFRIRNIKAQLLPSEFHGRKVTRLSNELQIVYIASHWAQEFKIVGGLVEILDTTYLLRNAQTALNWGQIFGWLQGSAAATKTYLMLTALDQYGLINFDPGVLAGLYLRQRSFGKINLRIMHALIRRYLVEGTAFGSVLSFDRVNFLWHHLLSPNTPRQNLMLLAQTLLRARLDRLKLILARKKQPKPTYPLPSRNRT